MGQHYKPMGHPWEPWTSAIHRQVSDELPFGYPWMIHGGPMDQHDLIPTEDQRKTHRQPICPDYKPTGGPWGLCIVLAHHRTWIFHGFIVLAHMVCHGSVMGLPWVCHGSVIGLSRVTCG